MVLYFSKIEESYNLPKLATFSLFSSCIWRFWESRDAILCLKQLKLPFFIRLVKVPMFPPINTREKRKVMQYLDTSLVSMLSAPLSSEKPP